MRHRAATRRRMRWHRPLILVVTLILLPGCGGSKATPRHLTLDTGPAPWRDPDQVPARVASAGLAGASSESLSVHYHAHLDIFVDGRPEPVAASIGREGDSFFSPLHTHAGSGMIHIEAPRDRPFTLGMLFTEWGVRLTRTCVGGYCRPATRISAYVDGHRAGDALPQIVFRKGEEIALVIGRPPSHIPSRWNCRAKIDPTLENPAQCADFGQSGG